MSKNQTETEAEIRTWHSSTRKMIRRNKFDLFGVFWEPYYPIYSPFCQMIICNCTRKMTAFLSEKQSIQIHFILNPCVLAVFTLLNLITWLKGFSQTNQAHKEKAVTVKYLMLGSLNLWWSWRALETLSTGIRPVLSHDTKKKRRKMKNHFLN